MSKHTPGPWRAHETNAGESRVVALGFVVAACNTFDPFSPTQRANARLIAKAPEMYGLLRLLVQHHNKWLASECNEQDFADMADDIAREAKRMMKELEDAE